MACELRVKGATLQEIANAIESAGLGPFTRQGVGELIKRVEKRILDEMPEIMLRHKSFQISALMNLYREGILALEQNKKRVDAEGNEVILEAYTDPKYSAEIRGVLADIRKLGGLDAPQKIAPTDPTGTEKYNSEVKSIKEKMDLLTFDELKQLEAITTKWEAADAKQHGNGDGTVQGGIGVSGDDRQGQRGDQGVNGDARGTGESPGENQDAAKV